MGRRIASRQRWIGRFRPAAAGGPLGQRRPALSTASLAAMAAMLTMPRLVVEGVRIWAGARVPIRIGPTARALFISFSRVIERLAESRLGKTSRLASPLRIDSG